MEGKEKARTRRADLEFRFDSTGDVTLGELAQFPRRQQYLATVVAGLLDGPILLEVRDPDANATLIHPGVDCSDGCW